ncbi:hypothetical protein ILUMI_04631 [Ignelater luminosus]|uniref:Uncharacterized protein n=1 Tax=Ignelater luminosus TaxID=2038154 RepID=A0A8K0D8S3_IGNLU|nr:hypothetical protein ILUMI_04631 [Ignelater luminosus]
MIDYALKKTKRENLYYIGHSQGTTVFYILCSEKPEYNEKIVVHISLAPIAYMNHMTSPLLQIVATGGRGLQLLVDAAGVGEFMPNTGFLGKVGNVLCSEDAVTQILCTNSMFALCGFNQRQMNATLLPIIMGHSPAGSSVKQVMHYIQEIQSGKFRQWDYGLIGNKKHYDNTAPPRYLLYKVTAPVYLFYSRNDWVSAERDVLRLYGELGNVEERILIADSKFNHIDYLYAIDARELVYENVIIRLKAHKSNIRETHQETVKDAFLDILEATETAWTNGTRNHQERRKELNVSVGKSVATFPEAQTSKPSRKQGRCDKEESSK